MIFDKQLEPTHCREDASWTLALAIAQGRQIIQDLGQLGSSRRPHRAPSVATAALKFKRQPVSAPDLHPQNGPGCDTTIPATSGNRE